MMSDERMPLAQAREIVERLVERIAGRCERIEIAGSIRRGRADVKDAEIVVIPTADLFADLDEMVAQGAIRKALYGEQGLTRWGTAYRGLVFDGLRVEIFTADVHSWGNQFWLRTGPGDANQFVMKWLIWKRAPLRFQGGHVWHSANWLQAGGVWAADDKRKLSLREEADLFAVLGMPEIEPGLRSDLIYRGVLGRRDHALPTDFGRWAVPEPRQEALPVWFEWSPEPTAPDVRAAHRAYTEQQMARHRGIFERAAAGLPLADWERRIVANREAIERMRGEQ
jgi:hypothetical protein